MITRLSEIIWVLIRIWMAFFFLLYSLRNENFLFLICAVCIYAKTIQVIKRFLPKKKIGRDEEYEAGSESKRYKRKRII